MAYKDEDFYCDYQIYINSRFADETDDIDEVMKIFIATTKSTLTVDLQMKLTISTK